MLKRPAVLTHAHRLANSLKNRTKLIRKRWQHRMEMSLSYSFQRKPRRPVFVLASYRTGSNLMLDYLRSVPGLSVQDEILHPHMAYGLRMRWMTRAGVYRHIRHSLNFATEPVVCVKMIIERLEKRGITPEMLAREFPEAKFIVTYRRSLIDQFVSYKIAQQTDQWLWSENFKTPSDLQIDAEEFRLFSERTRRLYGAIDRSPSLRGRSVFVSYEDLSRDAQGVFDRSVFPHLDIKPTMVWTQMRKQNQKRHEELVRNWRQIDLALLLGRLELSQ